MLFTANFYILLTVSLFTDTPFNILEKISVEVQKINQEQEKTLGGGVDLTFIIALIFLSLAMYLLSVAKKGNETLGYRFATFTFYSMQPNETLANAFIFNAFLNCALQAAVC